MGREAYFFNATMNNATLSSFSENCPNLEKITINGDMYTKFPVSNVLEVFIGFFSTMHLFNNLKEINMADFLFCELPGLNNKISTYKDLNDYPDNFLFHKFGKVLEKISIKNVRYVKRESRYTIRKLPQNLLIKFIRNAPNTL